MDINSVMTLIGSYGFPILACCAIAWFFCKTTENYRNDLKEINASHKEEINQLASVIQQNTLVIQKLCDSLDDLRKE